MESNAQLLILIGTTLVLLGTLLMALWLRASSRQHDQAAQLLGQQLLGLSQETQRTQAQLERVEGNLRGEVNEAARLNRGEMTGHLGQFQQALATLIQGAGIAQQQQLEGFAQQLAQLTQSNASQLETVRQNLLLQAQQMRDEQGVALRRFGEGLQQQLTQLTEHNAQRMQEIRSTLEQRLKDIELSNATKLEEMRRTVDEKLHATLEQRLGESFKQVSDRLEQVHRGLGEMQALAQGVGDLKKVLTNVKTRGTWGEVQLEMLLEQILTPQQYAKNVETVAGSGARVEFAIKLPGQREDKPVWLPIDAKFPREQYERLLEAQDRADAEGVLVAGKELEVAIRGEAQTIAKKYLLPPATTDFALLFLPTEGLYAEVLRRPGLSDQIQRDHRVTIAGPTTLTALLNSLQMGFRTLALEKRSSEVWEVLGAVKSEFGKFGDVLAQIKKNLESAAGKIEAAEIRTRQMARKLKDVEQIPSETAQALLGIDAEPLEPHTPLVSEEG